MFANHHDYSSTSSRRAFEANKQYLLTQDSEDNDWTAYDFASLREPLAAAATPRRLTHPQPARLTAGKSPRHHQKQQQQRPQPSPSSSTHIIKRRTSPLNSLEAKGEAGAAHADPLVSQQTDEHRASTVVVWTVEYAGVTRVVHLRHGKILGGRTIRVDGVVAVKQRKLLDDGSVHRLLLAFGGTQTLEVVVKIESSGLGFEYQLDAHTPSSWTSDDVRL